MGEEVEIGRVGVPSGLGHDTPVYERLDRIDLRD